ncbi:MAG: exonuclease domain-containing protein [Candidatus Woesearchaeota archaeon]
MRAYLDVETGGLDPKYNQIFSIGLILETDRIEEHLIRVAYDPRKPVHPGALRINGIDPHRWSGYPLARALTLVRELLAGHWIVAHNAPFDRGFLLAAAEESGIELLNEWSCTLDWSRRIPSLRSVRSRRLEALHEHLTGTAPHATHDALEDSRSCMRIAHALKNLDPEERYLRRITSALNRESEP